MKNTKMYKIILLLGSFSISISSLCAEQHSWLQKQFHELQQGIQGYQRYFAGESLTDQDKKAIKALTTKVGLLITALSGLAFVGYKAKQKPLGFVIEGKRYDMALSEKDSDSVQFTHASQECPLQVTLSRTIKTLTSKKDPRVSFTYPHYTLEIHRRARCKEVAYNSLIKPILEEIKRNKGTLIVTETDPLMEGANQQRYTFVPWDLREEQPAAQ